MTEELEFTLTFEERENYLYAFVTGPKDSFAVSRAFWTEIQSKATKLGIRKVMVEEDFPNQLSTMEMFDLGEILAKKFGFAVKIAFVDKSLLNTDLNKFGENVAVNRGFNGRVFNTYEVAEKWLRE